MGSDATIETHARGGPDPRMLGIYLNDHLAGATAGAGLARRIAREHRGTAHGGELRRLAAEIVQDRRSLLGIMDAVGVAPNRFKIYAGWAGERVGRFKPNGRLRRRSGLSTVLELEAMRLGVEGKALMWRALIEAAPEESRLDADRLGGLLDRAREQMGTLETLRLRAADSLFAPSLPPAGRAG